MEKFVVTITRQFGSLGRPIARRMSEILGIEYYDRDIVDQAAKKLQLPISVVDQEEERAQKQAVNPFSRMMFPLGKGTSTTQDKIFETQKNIIEFLAEKDNCIIVGRCSDFILGEVENSIHIYIYASYEARLEHCIKDLGMEETEARKMIKSVDAARDSYHMQYAGYLPDDKRHKDIMIDSSLFGVEGTAQFLAEAVKKKFYVNG
ncbi:MAG: AAA family ATPase [Muricoprocola sp.]